MSFGMMQNDRLSGCLVWWYYISQGYEVWLCNLQCVCVCLSMKLSNYDTECWAIIDIKFFVLSSRIREIWRYYVLCSPQLYYIYQVFRPLSLILFVSSEFNNTSSKVQNHTYGGRCCIRCWKLIPPFSPTPTLVLPHNPLLYSSSFPLMPSSSTNTTILSM